MRGLVLGGTGFLGRSLASSFGRADGAVERLGSRELNLLEPDAPRRLAERIDEDSAVVLASALTPPKGGTAFGLEANLRMASVVAAALSHARPAHCTYISSDAVYGWPEADVVEDTPVEPAGYYAIGKYAGEQILQVSCAQEEVPLLVLRPVAVFGPGDPHGAYGPNRFAKSIRERRSIALFGDGAERRDHLYVDDFAALTGALVASRATGVVNLASGTPRSFASVIDAMRRLVAFEVHVEHVPRSRPVTHRSYDVARLRAAAPDVVLTDFEHALEATMRGVDEHAWRPAEGSSRRPPSDPPGSWRTSI